MSFKPRLWVIVILLLSASTSFGQQNTFSPYSRYGFGEIAHKGFATHLGLGGANTAVRIPNQLNYLNPASYTTQDTNSFIFDVGLQGSFNQHSTNDSKIFRKTGGFDYLSIGFPVTSWWNASMGLVPYSNVGYSILTQKQYEDGQRNNLYQGKGGLRKFYIGNAFTPIENLSIGFNYQYLFGTLNYESKTGWVTDSTQAEIQQLSKITEKIINGSQFNIGLQYTIDFSENTNITIGGSYETTVNFNYEEYNSASTLYDTVYLFQSGEYNYPDNISAGIAFNSNKFVGGVDFNYTNWSAMNEYQQMNDSYSVHAGLQFTPDATALRNYLKRIDYRLGAFYKKGYLSFNENNIDDFGMTFGLGLPLKYQKTKFNLAVLIGKRGTTDQNLIESNYAIINFGITFYDFWFIERKYQ